MEGGTEATLGKEGYGSLWKLVSFSFVILIIFVDEEEERKKKEMKEQARKELEDWYKHHKEAIDKTRSANRSVLYMHYLILFSSLLHLSFDAYLCFKGGGYVSFEACFGALHFSTQC